MRKIIKFLRRLWERHKDHHGKFLVIYLDRDNDVRHRFQYANRDRAEESYKILEKVAKHSPNSHMIVQMFEDGHVIKHYDTEQSTVHPARLNVEENTLCTK